MGDIEKFIKNIYKNVSQFILKTTSPSEVFAVGEYSKARKILIGQAGLKNVTTIGIQHGVIHSNHPGYTFPGGILTRRKPDYFLAHGSAYCNTLNEIGYTDDTRVLCYGHPSVVQKTDHEDNYSDEHEKVLITSQPTYRQKLINTLTTDVDFSIRSYLNDTIILVKPHPNYENKSDFESLIRDCFLNVNIVDPSCNLVELIKRSDIHVSYTSTCIQESISLGTPTLELINYPQTYRFSDEFGDLIPQRLVYSTKIENIFLGIKELIESVRGTPISESDIVLCRRLFASEIDEKVLSQIYQ
jgi:hypothetical protein